MPPKKRPGKELLLKSPSQTTVGQVHEITQTTTQLQTSVEPRPATAETRRPGEPPEGEIPAMNTSMLSTQQQPQHQETEAQEDQQQDSDEEIKAIIKDELTRLR
jgi:hypothetical protein